MNVSGLAAACLLVGVMSCDRARPLGAGEAGRQRPGTTMRSPDARYRIGPQLHADDFATTDAFVAEVEGATGGNGRVAAENGALVIDVPAGATVWFRPVLEGPLMIEYDVTAISAGGANDRVSDVNCFWMASDTRSPGDLLALRRSGKFVDYNPLRCYYVGLGGNGNTTTRFRRYVGDPIVRPLLPEHDLSSPDTLLRPNVTQRIRLVAAGRLVQFYRDDRKLFELIDAEPYTRGHFGFRTVTSHLRIERLRVHRLVPDQTFASPSPSGSSPSGGG
ncbi:MAG TPA: DUF6250 domain-containing protein, partial [Tepidisphaeraceae bacterium]